MYIIHLHGHICHVICYIAKELRYKKTGKSKLGKSLCVIVCICLQMCFIPNVFPPPLVPDLPFPACGVSNHLTSAAIL